ncbi:Uncharacterized protein BP5553_02610 [Venustampulla echinocandica]|uniref:ER membrane protein complex subunit 7 beta-sandwich domain-containing protein n=1 Tax=Venustampulla echinocandica TaxID=2656787 RepID=A0A370TRW0_9HELO|nr:Uncharacterized protein BP5553_02610 [Venustampulla echinocandica]RDL38270.1 Uncharacterized protein BP5553_02610 [Venustampulla echinocandica]
MRISSLLAVLLSTPVLSTHLLVNVPSSPQLLFPSTLPASTSATLTTLSHSYCAPLRADNTFSFRNVTSGSYLLDVHAHTHFFLPLRVDIHEPAHHTPPTKKTDPATTTPEVEVWGTFRGNEWANKGEVVAVKKIVEQGKEVWTFDAKPAAGEKEYFIVRQGFSPLGLLKNPMILIAGASMLVVFGMPYLMDNMDPEMKAEFEERQKSSTIGGGAAANPLQNFDAAAWLAGSSGSGTSTPKKQLAEKGITR